MEEDFSVAHLSVAAYPDSPKAYNKPFARQTEPFLQGPVPIRWMQLAARSGKTAFLIGMILWFRRGLLKRPTVDLNLSSLGLYGLNRHTAGKGLRKLEKQRLALVERSKGKKSIVTILQIKPTEKQSLD